MAIPCPVRAGCPQGGVGGSKPGRTPVRLPESPRAPSAASQGLIPGAAPGFVFQLQEGERLSARGSPAHTGERVGQLRRRAGPVLSGTWFVTEPTASGGSQSGSQPFPAPLSHGIGVVSLPSSNPEASIYHFPCLVFIPATSISHSILRFYK